MKIDLFLLWLLVFGLSFFLNYNPLAAFTFGASMIGMFYEIVIKEIQKH